MSYEITELTTDLIPQAAEVWHAGWHEAHADIVPSDLTKLRTLDSFASRLVKYAATTRIAVQDGQVFGLCVVLKDEINQMYVSAQARGTGLAADLIQDGERRIQASGHATAWLACAVGNDRAARFYEKRGWVNARTEILRFEAGVGTYPLEIWRFEKSLT
ncbi:Acetyltransferase (GNAT) family protein [Falsiruegeria litorea R37]|uniref:Acetyltransferase (GNAT) family protein n=1 Tax=Falsiruegeria litorea R37 TaxID=1200284 RepID=A0A1Y5REU7_9RHOB|nr:GNAT family N-acetyltransferase [Falsiruegeria litorea]SLN14630.1 Acetyltransferase (GNAT) family protein [Falsiruegeria litorea R37]